MNIHYLAGLFDGEGTITLTKRKSTDLYRYPTLSLTSTTKVLCELMQQAFGGWIVTKKNYKDHHKPAWSWHTNGDKAVNGCAALVEYINEPQKKARMMLVVDLYKSVTPRNGKYSDQAKLCKEQFEKKFFSL
jgi:hypothetical protein